MKAPGGAVLEAVFGKVLRRFWEGFGEKKGEKPQKDGKQGKNDGK